MSPAEQEEVLELLEAYERNTQSTVSRHDLLKFCCGLQADYKIGAHHRKLAELLTAVEKGSKDRITVSVPPRHGKTQLCSIYFIAWYLGRNPTHKVMLVSHTTDLATDMGRKVRNVIGSPEFQTIFPGVSLASDSKSAGRWNTNHGGEFVAAGVGSSIAGRGAHLLVLDDVHSEQDVLAGNFEAFEKAYEWFTYGARTRLMPGGRVVIIGTRWHQADLIGRVQKDMQNPGTDQYEVFEFPAILTVDDPTTHLPVEKALWPEFFDLEALHRTKATMPTFQWNAQFMQNPTGEEGAIIKRDHWRIWTKDNPPACEYIIMALDAAAEAHNRADFTSLTTWGVFFNQDVDAHHIILLNAIKQRVEFPELKQLALREYREWKPDSFIVEKKSNGTPLYQELRRIGVVVQEYTPSRGSMKDPNTKMARLNAIADIVKSGIVWVPQTRWAEDLVEEVASFPFGETDDQCDTLIMALNRFRQGGFIRLPSDEADEPNYYRRRRGGYY